MNDLKHFLCRSCHRINRVATANLGKRLACGRCNGVIDQSAAPVDVNDALLSSVIQRSPVPVLVDFWAPWCGPCKAFAPQLDDFAGRHAGRVLVVKINTDDFQDTAARLGVQAVPTLALFKGGELQRLQPGALDRRELSALVAPHLSYVS